MSTYRYVVTVDEYSDPVTEWAEQDIHTEGMSTDEKADWLDLNQWITHYVEQQERCPHCRQWKTIDAIGGFDRHSSHYHDMADGGPLVEGTYELHELPPYVSKHFT